MLESVIELCGVIVAIESNEDEPFSGPEALGDEPFDLEVLGDEVLPLFSEEEGEGTVVIGSKLLGSGGGTDATTDESEIEGLVRTVDRVSTIVEKVSDPGRGVVLELSVKLSDTSRVVMLDPVVKIGVEEAKDSMPLDAILKVTEGAIPLSSAEDDGDSVGITDIPVSEGVSTVELDVDRATWGTEVLVIIKIDGESKEVDCEVLRKTSEVTVLVDDGLEAEAEVPDPDRVVSDPPKGNVMVVVVVLGGSEAVIHSIVVLVARGFDSEGRV